MDTCVQAFFDPTTSTYSYVVSDPTSGCCALIDPVLDYDPASGRTALDNAERLAAYVREHGLTVQWILETHVHADHLSAAAWLKEQLGGTLAIGAHISKVQQVFAKLFNAEETFVTDGSQFDRLLADDEHFMLGTIPARAIHTPGHTPACMSYLIGDALFVGDTLFMPDYGTARCDFPGGDARMLYRSIHKLYALPDDTNVFLCHDYLGPGRKEHQYRTTIGASRRENIHVREGVSEEEFVALRTARDATLQMPELILPSVQVNMRAGKLPPAEDNGVRYLKIPLNQL